MINKPREKRASAAILILLMFTVAAFFLRFYKIPENLFIGPEQGRDLLVVKSIVIDRNFTLIGPKTDINGIFHGPLFYYITVLPFILSYGNPLVISSFYIIIHSMSVILMYFLTKIMFDKRTAFIAVALFTISYPLIAYSRWLSNPPLTIPFSILFIYFFILYLSGRDLYLLLSALFLGLVIQVQFLNIPLFISLALVLLILNRKRLAGSARLYIWLSLIIFLITAFGTYFFFDTRHDLLITKNILRLAGGESGYHAPVTEVGISAVTKQINVINQSILPGSNIPSIVFFTFLIFMFFRGRYLAQETKNSLINALLWLFVPLAVLISFRHDILPHFLIYSIVPVLIMMSWLISRMSEKNKYLGILTIAIIIFFGLKHYFLVIPGNNDSYFQTNQKNLRYIDQKKVIQKIYAQSDSKPFEMQSYTIPYWWQDGWTYLFWYFGTTKYGYTPVDQKAPYLYVMIQDDPAGENFQKKWLLDTVSKWGEKKSEFRFGILTVYQLKT